MGLDVVGVAVAAVGVVGDDDVGPQVADDGDEFADRLAHVGVDEPLLVSRPGAVHAGVAPMTGAAKEIRLFYPKGVECGGQLADAIPAQLIGLVDGQLRILLADDFTFFTEGAGDDVDVGAVGGVVRDSAAGRQRFVVRVGVDEEQTGRFLRRH